MKKDEAVKLAKSLGAIENEMSSDGAWNICLTEQSLLAFANACEKTGMGKAGDMLSDALQSDLEHGVKRLNERAAIDFHTSYPELSKTIGKINSAERVE